MLARILVDDEGGRWKAGEVGIVLVNDSDKYDYKIQLPGDIVVTGPRRMYFYKNEVKLVRAKVIAHKEGGKA